MTASTSPEPVTMTCPHAVPRPVMLQGWYDLTSLHWPYDPAAVQRLLPPGLEVDTCDGQAWVGLIPFHMRRIRVPGLPAFGPLSTFPETNVRTYVVLPDGQRAVWFCSLDVTRIVPAVVARVSYGLPYCWSQMSIAHRSPNVIEYESRRRWPERGPSSRVAVEVAERVDDSALSELELFVTARWALASTFLGVGLRANIEHAPWPVHRARVIGWQESLIEAVGLPAPSGQPFALWSPGVEVRIGRPTRIRGAWTGVGRGTEELR